MLAGICIVLLLLLPSGHAESESLHVSLAAMPGTENAIPEISGLQAGLQRLFESQYSTVMSVDFTAGPATQAAGAVAKEYHSGDPSASVILGAADGRITVSTDLTRADATRSLVSIVPPRSSASLLATMASDLAFLYVSSRGFSTLPLSTPPAFTASLSIDTLGSLTGWNPEDLEPVGLSASGDEITICFPHRYLTLGPQFRISASTIRDISGQGAGREPMLLSGALSGQGDDLVLLSEHEGRIAAVNPRLGTRQLMDAPGLSALPARLAGQGPLAIQMPRSTVAAQMPQSTVAAQMPRSTVAAQMPQSTVAALSGSPGEPGLNLYRLGGGSPGRIDIAASYVPAFDQDREGNFWAWDAGERRVRILTPGGREVYSIKPFIGASTMQLPQRLEVLDDGSFLLSGSAEVWKFQGSGVPVWRLARIPGRPGESLPSSFDLGVNRATGSFVILDAQSRRLLAFSDSPPEEAARQAELLARLDLRKQADIRELAVLAEGSGLGLMALQFGDLLARSGGSAVQRQAARISVLREKAKWYSSLADGLARDLLFDRADAAYLRTAETLRELTAESPEDSAAAGLLQTVLARRREVRAALAVPGDVKVVSARLLVEQKQACASELALLIRLRNSGAMTLTGVRVHASIPGAVPTPSLVDLGAFPPSTEREVRIPFGPLPDEAVPASATVAAYALVTGDRGREGISSSLSISAPLTGIGGARSLADVLACRTVPQDTLAASLPLSLLSGAVPDSPQPLLELAGILDALGAARRGFSAGPGGPDQDSAAVTVPPAPAGMRASLRALSRDEAEWTVVTASIAQTLGMPSAILSVGDRAVALVDTGIPFFSALSEIPGLERFRQVLAFVSSAGTLWVPLSGRVPPPTAQPWSWSFADALDLLAGHDVGELKRSNLIGSADRENAPIPFPLVLPVIAEPPSLAAVRGAANAAAGSVTNR